jgi:hypothetical protein
MPEYVERARRMAELLATDSRIAITPAVPQSNAFHLLLPGSAQELTERNREFARRNGIWLFNGFYESPVAGRSIGEVVMGDNSDAFEIADAARWIRAFLDLA